MNETFIKTIARNTEHPFTGSKVTRKGKVMVATPANLEEAVAYFGSAEKLILWANHGARSQAVTALSAALMGTLGSDAELSRTFKQSLNLCMTVMGMDRGAALDLLLSKDQFKSLRSAVEASLKEGEIVADYTGSAPSEPAWFSGPADETTADEPTE